LLAIAKQPREKLAEQLREIPSASDQLVESNDVSKVDKAKVDRMCQGWKNARGIN